MKYIYALALILAINIAAFAQTDVQIAQDKIKKDGVVMYVHNVRQSETLYSISKAYNISIKEITEHNQALGNGLKTGMILYIPDKLSNALQSKSDETKGKDKQESRKKRKLSRQERIANALRKTVTEQEYGEDNMAKETAAVVPSDSTATTTEIQDSSNIELPVTGKLLSREMAGRSTRLSLVLPFNSKDTANLNSNFMDFYAGALLALDSLSMLGTDVTLDVIDQKDYHSIEEIGLHGRLGGSDIVIGPVKRAELEAIRPYIGEHTLLVSPMDQNASSLTAEESRFVQIPTGLDCQLDALADCIALESRRGISNVVIIYESGNADSLYLNSITKGLSARQLSYSTLHYNILEGRSVEDRILAHLRDNVKNIVIVPSNNEAFVSDAVRNLSLLNSEERPIILFGMPKWKNFEVIDIYQLHQLNLHLSLPYYVDYDNPITKRFVDRYKELYNTYPTPYAFQGYDILFYMVYARYMGAYNALQSNFVFKSGYDYRSGYYNTGTKNIIYNRDFTISVED